jgi:hypothetical protein
MTKAYFKDNNPQKAVEHLKSEIESLKQGVKDRESLMLDTFNKEFDAFSSQSDVLSYDQFKVKYLHVIQKLHTSLQESQLVNMIDSLQTDMDFEQLETLM